MTDQELKDAKRKYYLHTAHCKNKTDKNGMPVEMRLSFDQWLDIWLTSGHWHERGRKREQYCMSRLNDIGHYETGNVQIITGAENTRGGIERRVKSFLANNAKRGVVPYTEYMKAGARERMRRYRERLKLRAAESLLQSNAA